MIKFCTKPDCGIIRHPGATWCREHYNEYQRDRRAKIKAETDAYLLTHNERGEDIDEFGMTFAEQANFELDEAERLDRLYGTPNEG